MIATAMSAARASAASASGTLVGQERVEHVLDEVVAVAVSADPDADSRKRIGAPRVDERLHAPMAGSAAPELDLDAPEREVRLVVDDDRRRAGALPCLLVSCAAALPLRFMKVCGRAVRTS